ncbi:hypothetical protein ACIQ9R_35195 [Streptomyces sp. NPDC094447]|uniref:hypothetical protein n=1 Tax=Streptomyces sp. NPDC094447 TaxID=3366062 RepID=UPI003827E644
MSVVLAPAAFAAGARDVVTSLETHFLHDEDLANDLDAVLGAPSGPVNLTHRRRGRRLPGFMRRRSPEPTCREVAEVGRAVTRLDRMVARLISIAKRREWIPPYPNVVGVVVFAEAVREQHGIPVGDFITDRAHLRHLAMAAADLLAVLDLTDAAPPDSRPRSAAGLCSPRGPYA